MIGRLNLLTLARMTVKNYYTILGLTSSASKEEIKAAYRKLVRQFHPDRNFGSEDHFKLIQEAYEVLSDDKKRDVYDARLVYETYVADPDKREKFYEEQKDKPRRYKKSSKVKQKAAKRRVYINSSGAAVALIVLAIAVYNFVITQRGKAQLNNEAKYEHKGQDYKASNAKLANDYFTKAKNNVDAQNFKFAIIYFTNAIELTPNDPKLYFNRGLVHYFLENYNKALSDLDRTVKLDPQYRKAFWVRAKLKYDLDDNKGAIADYTSAINLDPTNDSLYFNRGLAYFYMQDYESAIKDIDKAIQINPNQPQYYFDRGDAKEMSGDTDGTCSDWRKAKELGYLSPDFKLKKCISPS